MNLRSRTLLILVAVLLSAHAPTAAAQIADTTYGTRALARFFANLRSDTRLPDSLRGLTFGRLDSLPVAYYALLDDSSASLWLQTQAAVLRQLPDSACAAVMAQSDNNAFNLSTILAGVDSTTVDALLLVHQRVLLALTRPVARRTATPEEFRTAMGRVMSQLRPVDQQRFVNIARNPPPNHSDACWAARTLIGQLAELSPSDLGPLFRAMSQPPRRGN